MALLLAGAVMYRPVRPALPQGLGHTLTMHLHRILNERFHVTAHLLLLHCNGEGRVNGQKAELFDHLLVFLQQAALKDTEGLLPVIGKAHVLPGFVIPKFLAACGESLDGNLQRHPEVQAEGGLDGEGVDAAHPVAVDAPGRVPGEGGVHVPIREDDGASPERR